MTILFCRDKIINVNVANGSAHTILCRVIGDTALKVQGTTGGCTEIQKGNTLKFELRPSSKNVYMTVYSETKNGRTICKNYEIDTSSNYIINRRGSLSYAKKNQKWIDTDGCNHMVTYDDEDGLKKKRM